MPFPEPQFLDSKGVQIATYVSGPETGPPVLLVHGWPEIAYSWKHQMEPLAGAGFRVIAMDVRGFGASDVPKTVRDYGIEPLVGDVTAVLDAHKCETAVICGHDWGGIISWHAARMLEARVSHVISVCTPHVQRPPVDPVRIFRKRHGDQHYFVRFCDDPDTYRLFEQDVDAFFRLMFRLTPPGTKLNSRMFEIPETFKAFMRRGAPALPGAILPDADRAVYVQAYKKTGFFGGVNLYRNTKANWEFDRTLADTINQPALMISARQDLFLPPEMTAHMPEIVPDLERHVIESCGHWVMWEQPQTLNTLMLDWLDRRL